MEILLRPIHKCPKDGRQSYWANEQWFEGIAPLREQSVCAGCGEKFPDPLEFNHITQGNLNYSYGMSYKVIYGEKIDRRKLRGKN